MDEVLPKWEIECGYHAGVIAAKTLGAAWRRFASDKTDGFAPLARWREGGGQSLWRYQTPQSLEQEG